MLRRKSRTELCDDILDQRQMNDRINEYYCYCLVQRFSKIDTPEDRCDYCRSKGDRFFEIYRPVLEPPAPIKNFIQATILKDKVSNPESDRTCDRQDYLLKKRAETDLILYDQNFCNYSADNADRRKRLQFRPFKSR